jgi:hypothetical protein
MSRFIELKGLDGSRISIKAEDISSVDEYNNSPLYCVVSTDRSIINGWRTIFAYDDVMKMINNALADIEGDE